MVKQIAWLKSQSPTLGQRCRDEDHRPSKLQRDARAISSYLMASRTEQLDVTSFGGNGGNSQNLHHAHGERGRLGWAFLDGRL